jgi:endonuclease/exonuclease/phosphatase family metal-dependent hydrolase
MATQFSVMTWNLENLFGLGTEFGPDTPDEFNQKIEGLARTILELDPDVVAVQEVGGSEPFGALQAALGGRYPHNQLSVHPDTRGILVGFLSKLSFEDSEDILEFPEGALQNVPGIDGRGDPIILTRLGRGALRILVRPNADLPVHLITAHLKSKLLTFPRPTGSPSFSPRDENERARVAGFALQRRMAEAIALRVRANRLLEGDDENALILLGDMNDVTDAATTQILIGPPGSELGTPGFDRPDRGDNARLFNLAPLIPEEHRFSRVFRGRGELIDHILVSHELLPGTPRRVPIVDSHIDRVGGLPSIETNPNERRGRVESDHAPVTATFEL